MGTRDGKEPLVPEVSVATRENLVCKVIVEPVVLLVHQVTVESLVTVVCVVLLV